MEVGDHAELLLPVAVEVQQHGVAGRDVQQLRDGPLRAGEHGRLKEEGPLLGADDGGVVSAPLRHGEAVVFEQAALNELQLELVVVVEGGQILRQHRAVDRAGEAPVVLELMAGFEAADDQVVHAAAVKDAEAVDVAGVDQGAALPPVPGGGIDDDGRLRRVVGAVEAVGGEELAVRAGDLQQGHDPAFALPDALEQGAVLVKEEAVSLLFRADEEAVLPPVAERSGGVTLGQPAQDLLFYFQSAVLSATCGGKSI